MIVYHGTSKKNGENILKTRKIMTNQNKNWTDTTEGYVYLSNDIIKALSYGNKSCSTSHLENIFLFKVDVPYELLMPDKDEAYCKGIKVTETPQDLNLILEECKSTRVNFSLNFNEYNVHYCEIKQLELDGVNYIEINNEKYKLKDINSAVNCCFSKTDEIYSASQKKFISEINWIKL